MHVNPLTQIDFYKVSHRKMYPEGTGLIYSNFTPRSIKHLPTLPQLDDKIVSFGLQYIIKYFLRETFNDEFFGKPKEQVVKRYKRRLDTSLGGDNDVSHIEALHDLGYLPLEIRALPEGSAVPVKTPLFTIHNTLPEFYWLTNYLETAISALAWKSCTSATTARKYRMLFNKAAMETVGNTDFVKYQGHDFSFRGMSGLQDAVMSGAAHLLSFVGTDTVAAIDFLEDYYFADAELELIGCSVPASEHSCVCIGTCDGEFETFRRLIQDQYPKGILSLVSDTWDYWSVLTDFLPKLKEVIMNRDGKIVIRPDSGDPVKIIAGDPDAPMGSPENLGSIQVLWNIFGGTITEKGYKQLDSHIGLIYGDSISLDVANRTIERLKEKGFASTNVVFGIGSFTYEHVTRDSLGFAMKATAGIVNGETRLIEKSPKTDTGTKKSACGFLAVHNVDGEYVLTDRIKSLDDPLMKSSLLQPIYRDGCVINSEQLALIRARIEKSL